MTDQERIAQLEQQLAEARAQAEEWKAFNLQRLEDVYAARKLLDAQPHETLPMAVERVLKDRPIRCTCPVPSVDDSEVHFSVTCPLHKCNDECDA